MKKVLISACLFVIWFWAGEVQGYSKLYDLISEADTNNLEIQAMRLQYEAMKTRTSAFRYLDDPWFSIEFGADMRMYSISQEFPFPTKISGRSSVARYEAQQLYEEYQNTMRKVTARLKSTYGQLYVISKEIDALKKSRDILNQIFRIAQQNYVLNQGSQVDVLRMQVELSKIENELLNLDDERKVMMAELNAILNRPLDTDLGDFGDMEIQNVSLDISALDSLAIESHPGLKSLRFAIKSKSSALSLAKQEYLPDFMVRFEQEEMDGQFMDSKFMFGLTLPIWALGKQRNMVSEMQAEKMMAEAEYKAMENMVLVQVHESKIRVDKQKRQMNLYRNRIIPQIEAVLNVAVRAYEVNQIDFLTVLDNQRALIETQLENYQVQADYFIAVADLEAAVGAEIVVDDF